MKVVRIYVAGKTHDFQRVRKVQTMCRARGYIITHDWTDKVEHHGAEHEVVEPSHSQQQEYATADLRGVFMAHLVIALGHPKLCGTLVEVGAALAPTHIVGKDLYPRKVWLVGVEQPSVFWHLPQVTTLANDNDIPHELDGLK